jgi:hypothetical protein
MERMNILPVMSVCRFNWIFEERFSRKLHFLYITRWFPKHQTRWH